MKLNLIWIRSKSDAEIKGVIDRYLNRIKHFFPIEVTEVAPLKGRQGKSDASIMHAGSARLLNAIPAKGTVVVLDERGTAMTSLRFAEWLDKEISRQPYGIHFVMGGDVGFDDTVRERAHKLLSLSAMTLPHQLARAVLAEQLYRACTLIRNVPYHK